MRPSLAPVACAFLLAAAGCGDDGARGGASPVPPAGAGGAAGSWTLDAGRTVDSTVATLKVKIEEMRRQAAAAPPEIRAEMEARLPKDDAALRADVEDKTKSLSIEIELRADGTSRAKFDGPPGAEVHEGTWEARGDDVYVTAKSKNGAPVQGADARPQHFARRDGRLVLVDEEGTTMFWLKRK